MTGLADRCAILGIGTLDRRTMRVRSAQRGLGPHLSERFMLDARSFAKRLSYLKIRGVEQILDRYPSQPSDHN